MLKRQKLDFSDLRCICDPKTFSFKTTTQIVALLLLLYHHPLFGIPTHWTGLVLLNIAAGLTLWSMVVYLHAALRALNALDEEIRYEDLCF